MSKLLSNLTAAALFVHALLGCCWHHGHDCRHALAASEHAERAVAFRYDDACNGRSPDRQPANEEPRHGDDGCQTVPCAFVATHSGPTALEFLVQHPDLAVVAAIVSAEHAEVSRSREPPSPCAGDCLAVRLHLLHRVLLI